nr:MAG TPA_asm: hypothetical protein [Caudoviricetes sp.]
MATTPGYLSQATERKKHSLFSGTKIGIKKDLPISFPDISFLDL